MHPLYAMLCIDWILSLCGAILMNTECLSKLVSDRNEAKKDFTVVLSLSGKKSSSSSCFAFFLS